MEQVSSSISWDQLGVILAIITLLLSIFGGIIVWLLNHYQTSLNSRLDGLEISAKEERGEYRRLDREIQSLRAYLLKEYVRREDWIRFGASIDAKQDALAAKIDTLGERIHARG